MQMKLYRLAGLLAAALGLSSPVFAQNASDTATRTKVSDAALIKALESAITPGPGQARLEPMIGTFDVKIRTWLGPNQPPTESSGSCVNVWVLGHRYLQSMLSANVMGERFDGIGYTAYDNVGKVYQTAWMDGGSTAMTIYRGGFNGATKSATMKAVTANPVTGKPTQLELRLSIAENGDHMSELWGQGNGTALFKMMELRYTRTKQ
jgi:hypothetical protein